MSVIGGVLSLASSIVSAAASRGGDECSASSKSALELDVGQVKISLSADKGLEIKPKDDEGDDDDEEQKAPPLDLSSDRFEPPKRPPLLSLLDAKSGIGSKPGGVGDGRA
jgi:hypothetical protein